MQNPGMPSAYQLAGPGFDTGKDLQVYQGAAQQAGAMVKAGIAVV